MTLRHLINGIVLAGILALAALVQHTAPDDDAWQAPMEVSGQVGEPVTGRNIEATVWGARVAEKVETPDWTGETTGIWVVVDVSAEAVVDEFAAGLGTAELLIDGTTYSASERPDLGTLYRSSLSVGIPTRGSLFFEIPKSALTDARLLLAVNNDPRLDSALAVDLDLAALDREPLIRTERPEWGAE